MVSVPPRMPQNRDMQGDRSHPRLARERDGEMNHRVAVSAPHVTACGPFARHPLLWVTAGLAGVYVAGATAVLFAPPESEVAVWWPAAGISVAMLVLLPRGPRLVLAFGLLLISSLANFSAGRAPLVSLGFGLSNAAEAWLVAWWLTRGVRGRPALHTMENLWRLLSATLIGNLAVGIGIGTTVEYMVGGEFLQAAPTVMASHAAAILLIVPLFLDLAPRPGPPQVHQELAQWLLYLGAVGFVFGPGQDLDLGFLSLPLLIWAALRMGLRTVSVQLLVLGIVVTGFTARGWGPFALSVATGITDAATTASLVQAFLITTAGVALTLAVGVAQRRAATVRMSESEELFRKSFRESVVGMLLLRRTEDGLRIAELNETAATILGGDAGTLEGRLWGPLLDTDTAVEEVAARLATDELDGWREELWLHPPSDRRVSAAMSVLSVSGEEPVYTVQMVDVTDAHTAATRLKTEKDFTSAILDTTACLILVLDLDGNVIGFNPAVERASGYTEAEVLGRPAWTTVIPAQEEAIFRRLLSQGREAATGPTEGDLATRDRRHRRRIVWSHAFLDDDSGRPSHLVMTGIDVTDERTARSMVTHLLEAATTTSLIGTDLQGTITAFNTGARVMLGYEPEEVLDAARLDLVHDADELRQRARELQVPPGLHVVVHGAAEGPQTRDWTYVHKDRTRITASVTTSAVRDALGQHIGYLAVGRDVTEQRRSEEMLMSSLAKEREAAERLRELDQAKNDFVSTVSHELRTPITSIVGYTELLQDGVAGKVTDAQGRLLEAVWRNGERLIALIEDLLTLSRIEAGTFLLERVPVDLRSVVHRSREALEPMLDGRSLDVGFELPSGPVPVLGDPGQLERVVLNLMGNAVKFTEDGGRVECRLRQAGSHAEMEVADTGIGIPANEQAEIFSRFFRSSTAQQRAIQGTGLGLSIVQSIVHSHGGEITVRSEHLRGTEVLVSLPTVSSTRLGGPEAQP
jgi:PAS domain S-box-containing protein